VQTRRRRQLIAVASGILLGLGVVLVVPLVQDGGPRDGARTPEEATRRLFDAIGDQELDDALAILVADERFALGESFEPVGRELRRLGFGLDRLPWIEDGLRERFAQPRLSTTPLGDDLAAVVWQRDPDTSVLTVREDGRWYVSLAMTMVADSMEGEPLPDPDGSVSAADAASPEQAVAALVEAAAEQDDERFIRLLAPEDGRGVREFASLVLDANAELPAGWLLGDLREATGKPFLVPIGESGRATVDELELSTAISGRTAIVTVERAMLSGKGEERGSRPYRQTYEGGCKTETSAGHRERVCNPFDRVFDPFGTSSLFMLLPFPTDVLFFVENVDIQLPPIELAFVAVRHDGGWLVSLTRTHWHNLALALREFDQHDVAAAEECLRTNPGPFESC
jgi:hypothetical protein